MTAMQEVYDKLNSTNVTIKELFNWLADNETRLLAKEREQIVEARMMDETCSLNNAEQYESQYAHQQPVQGYSREQVNEAMDKIETMEALENTMKPQYKQPVNDGWRVYNTGVDITEQCTFESGVITINSNVVHRG